MLHDTQEAGGNAGSGDEACPGFMFGVAYWLVVSSAADTLSVDFATLLIIVIILYSRGSDAPT